MNLRKQLALFLALALSVAGFYIFRNQQGSDRYNDAVQALLASDIDNAGEVFGNLALDGDLKGIYGAAWVAYLQGEYDKAGLWSDHVESNAKGSLKAAALYLQGLIDIRFDMFERARLRLTTSREIYANKGKEDDVFRCQLVLARIALYSGKLEQILLIGEGLPKDKTANSAEYHLIFGQLYYGMNDLRKAKESLNKAISLFRESRDIPGESRALSELGWQLILSGKHEEGMDLTSQAIEIMKVEGESIWHSLNVFAYERCKGFSSKIEKKITSHIMNSGDKMVLRAYNLVNEKCKDN